MLFIVLQSSFSRMGRLLCFKYILVFYVLLRLSVYVLTTTDSRAKVWTVTFIKASLPQWLRLWSILRRWFFCCLFIVCCCFHCLFGFCMRSLFWTSLICVLASFAIILLGKESYFSECNVAVIVILLYLVVCDCDISLPYSLTFQ